MAQAYPGLPGSPAFGFSYDLDTARFANGPHRLQVMAVDAAGNADWLIDGNTEVEFRN